MLASRSESELWPKAVALREFAFRGDSPVSSQGNPRCTSPPCQAARTLLLFLPDCSYKTCRNVIIGQVWNWTVQKLLVEREDKQAHKKYGWRSSFSLGNQPKILVTTKTPVLYRFPVYQMNADFRLRKVPGMNSFATDFYLLIKAAGYSAFCEKYFAYILVTLIFWVRLWHLVSKFSNITTLTSLIFQHLCIVGFSKTLIVRAGVSRVNLRSPAI